jgi:hypothetical protein
MMAKSPLAHVACWRCLMAAKSTIGTAIGRSIAGAAFVFIEFS